MALANSGIPIGQWSGSDATRELHKTIQEFNKQSSKQTRTIIWLTVVIAVLTFVMTVGVGVQVWKIFWP